MKVKINHICRMPTKATNSHSEYSLTQYVSDNPSNLNRGDYNAITHTFK